MFVSIHRESPREHLKLFVAGVVFMTSIAILIGLSIAIYNKTFESVTTVTLRAERAGLQLPKYGDVRYNGVLVGQIRSISQTGDEAVIELGLENDDALRIPENVEANILPTTLFGQKYVALVDPATPGPLGLVDGTVIPREHVHTATELSQVLNRLFPLLRAVRPVDLSSTLSALATALSGRGEALGQTFDRLDTYLTTINQHLPTLREDLRLLATVADAYDVAAPDLVGALANLTVTSRTITERKGALGGLLGDVRDVGITGAELLEDNEANILRVGDLSVPLVRLLEKYAPEYNCLLRGIARYKPILLKTFEGGQVKQYVEFPSPQVRAYDERDLPEYNDKRGPRCLGLPNNPPLPWPGYDTDNGTELDNMRGRGTSYFPDGNGVGRMYAGVLGGASYGSAADASWTQEGRLATAAELSERSGQPTGDLTELGTLMYAPMAEGAS